MKYSGYPMKKEWYQISWAFPKSFLSQTKFSQTVKILKEAKHEIQYLRTRKF